MAKKARRSKKEILADASLTDAEKKKLLAGLRGRTVRTRGHSFERETAIELRPIFPNARRLLENHKDDANGVDLMHTGHYRVQCKRSQRYAQIARVLAEVQCDREMGEVPLLVTRVDNEESLVTLPWCDFLGMLKTLHRAGVRAALAERELCREK